jgi:hypothetical protein
MQHDPLDGYEFERGYVECSFAVPESDLWAIVDCPGAEARLAEAIRATCFAVPDDQHGMAEPMAGCVFRFLMEHEQVTPENVEELAGIFQSHVATAKAELAARDREDQLSEWFDIVNMSDTRDPWTDGNAWAEYNDGSGVDSFTPRMKESNWDSPGESIVELLDGDSVAATVRLADLLTVYEDTPGRDLAQVESAKAENS